MNSPSLLGRFIIRGIINRDIIIRNVKQLFIWVRGLSSEQFNTRICRKSKSNEVRKKHISRRLI